MFLIILSCVFLATTLAAPQNYYQQAYNPQVYNKPVVPIVSETNQIEPDGSFSYSYVTGDGQQAQAQGYLKNRGVKDAEAEVIQGSYSYTAPDGTPISLSYVADENGFRAEGAHLPTPPPIPAEIQKALDLIARTQPAQNQYQQPAFQQPAFQQPAFQQSFPKRYRF